MKMIVLLIFMAVIVGSCGTNKRVYAPPFEEEQETAIAAVQETTEKREKGSEKPIVAREEKVVMTHGEVLKRYHVVVGSFAEERNAINLRNRLVEMGCASIIARNDRGMSRVSIAGFDEEAAARTELARVRERYPEFADAWLLVAKR